MKLRYAVPAFAALSVLVLSGCTNTEGDAPSADAAVDVSVDKAAAALLPDDIRDSGILRLGSDMTVPPNEYKASDGTPSGWGVELAEAVAAKLGLEPKWEILGFDSILPRIEEGTVDLGDASFTDTLERQKTVDFVNYYVAGSQWATTVDNDVDPDNACGLTVAVAQGTIQHTDELPVRNEQCAADGKEPINILVLDDQPDIVDAVVQGRADAFSADSPMTGDAVLKRGEEIHAVGELFATAPYGFATQKGSDTTRAVQAALQSLIDDGTYLEILTAAGVESGAVEEATINAGKE
jgi:polar amino acid transport system substrate-binding protein